MSHPLVYIVMLIYNNYSDSANCLQSCLKLSYSNLKILVVDNHSKDDCLQKLQTQYKDFNQILFMQNLDNYGYAEGNNLGIQYALDHGAEYVFVINNDVLFDHPNLIESLLSPMVSVPQIGILGPNIYQLQSDNNYRKLTYPSKYFELISRLCVKPDRITKTDREKYSIVDRVFVSGSAMFISRKLLQDIGGFDPDFFMFLEEITYCLKASLAHYLVCESLDEHCTVRHIGGVSYGHKTPGWKSYLRGRNIGLLIRPFSGLGKIKVVLLNSIYLLQNLHKYIHKRDFSSVWYFLLGTIESWKILIYDMFGLSKPKQFLKSAQQYVASNVAKLK